MTSASPKAKLCSIAPQFLVLDLDQACCFYRDKLGFEVAFTYSDFYAGVTRDGLMIHLKRWDEADPSRAFKQQHEHLDVYINTDQVAELYREFQSRGVVFLKPLEPTPWGTQEFVVQDTDGYILYFGQEA
jgi:catechol 2,3-dioxygenase-like lactoylglutathione lyase family enzyme